MTQVQKKFVIVNDFVDDFVVDEPRDPEYFVEIYKKYKSEQWNGWYLPGTGFDKTNDYCMKYSTFAICKNDKNYLRKIAKNCQSLACGKCHSGAETERTKKIEAKLLSMYRENSEIFRHVVISPKYSENPNDFDYKTEVKRIYKVLREEFYGGVIFFHPWRFNHETKEMRWSPHWHLVCQSPFIELDKLQTKYDMVIINLGWRDFMPRKVDVSTEYIYNQDGCSYKTDQPIVIGVNENGPTPIYRTIRYIISHSGLLDTHYIRKTEVRRKLSHTPPMGQKVLAAPSHSNLIYLKKELRQKNCYNYFGNLSSQNYRHTSTEVINVPDKCPLCGATLLKCDNDSFNNGARVTVQKNDNETEELVLTESITKFNVKQAIDSGFMSPSIQKVEVKRYEIYRPFNTAKGVKFLKNSYLSILKELEN